jgi:hypothetical protein
MQPQSLQTDAPQDRRNLRMKARERRRLRAMENQFRVFSAILESCQRAPSDLGEPGNPPQQSPLSNDAQSDLFLALRLLRRARQSRS